jgi:hypothetical protein
MPRVARDIAVSTVIGVLVLILVLWIIRHLGFRATLVA